jgi:hypothetical protein
MLILGLLLLAAAGVAGSVGVLSNRGTGHQMPGGFNALGYTMHGSTGQVFFWGIVAGCVATLGLVLVLGGLRGGLKRRGTARRNATWRKRSEKSEKAARLVADPVTPEPVEALPAAAAATENEAGFVKADPVVDKVGS